MLDSRQYERLVGTIFGQYYLEQLSEWNELGPVFIARHSAGGGTVRLRLIDAPFDMTSDEFATYLKRFDHQARHLATLQHPYILPLTQYGSVASTCFVVSPNPTARALTTRLQRSGPLDVLTAGRYLDQVAAALEYAHERNTLHRNLTTDALLLQLDGQVVVADLGVRRMLELAGRDGRQNPLRFLNGSCAPEQLLGAAVDRATDVYALGAVLYELLTGYPVFTGSTAEEIVEQHLRAPVPPVGAGRGGLPASLDAVFAKALAKRPQERFQHPGELANAYHQVVSPNNPARVPFVISQPVRMQEGRSPTYAPQSYASQPGRSDVGGGFRGMGNGYGAHIAELEPLVASASSSRPISANGAHPPGRRRQAPFLRIAVAALVLIALAVGGVFGLRAIGPAGSSGNAAGQVFFVESQGGAQGQTDGLRLEVHNLAEPPSGSTYYAWLVDTQTENVTPLGTLHLARGAATLNYAGGASSGANLLGLGNTVEITQESGRVSVPVGKVMLAGSFPPKTFVHIQHVLVAFPATPNHIGLLPGVLQQFQLLTTRVQALSQAAASHDQASVQCEAQSIVNILEGAKGANYRALPARCTARHALPSGDGFGLLGPKADGTGGGYIADATEHASLAVTQPDAPDEMRPHAAQVEAALTNVRNMALTLHKDALALAKNPGNTSKVPEMVKLTTDAHQGADTNGDGKPDQGGLLTAYAQAQLMATLPLVPRP
jgi:serine/threonine protein kinase